MSNNTEYISANYNFELNFLLTLINFLKIIKYLVLQKYINIL